MPRCPRCNYDIVAANTQSRSVTCPECGEQVNMVAMQLAEREAGHTESALSREVAIGCGTLAALAPLTYAAIPLLAYALAPVAADGSRVPVLQSGGRIASLRTLIDFCTCCGLPILVPGLSLVMVASLAKVRDAWALRMGVIWTACIAAGILLFSTRWWWAHATEAWAWFLR